jgi:aspartyl-tRNA(Asn)/glutamyl-tRNA(Gln) amidotransferase subunit C
LHPPRQDAGADGFFGRTVNSRRKNMAMTRADVTKIAELAKLRFSASELEAFTAQFQHILEYIEKLREVPVDDVAPTSHVALPENFDCLRNDEVKSSLAVEDACGNAPDCSRGHFRVPRVIQFDDDIPGAG